ncbi:MAG: gamma-glutamyl-gamma-aminobutyrate hydrolase family protein [Thermoanaerobaculia bacterium]
MKILIASDGRQPNEFYRGSLLCAGALPEEVSVVCPGDPVPEHFDGLLIAGGSDVDPSHYGEAASHSVDVNSARDALDFQLFAAAERRSLPIFGICRGMQMINVALGGTLWQDLPSERNRGLEHDFDRAHFDPAHSAHTIKSVATGSSPVATLFRGAGEFIVNSRHHQAVKDLAAGLRAIGGSPDDLVEAYERTDGAYLAAVQWHPENLVGDPFQKALLQTFLDACRAEARRAVHLDPPPIEVSLEGRIAVVRINRPAKKNAFAGTMREMLARTIEALGQDATVPAIVLTGAGSCFSAGGDLETLRALSLAKDVAGFRALLDDGARAVLSIVKAPKPVLAAIDGAAAGAGMNLALACDVRFASTFERFEAFFAQSFAAIGLAPDWGGTYHLPLLAGSGSAADLVFSAERISAQRAKELGLVEVLVTDGSALPAALSRAALYAERPAAALAAAKLNLNAERLPRLEQALAREAEAQIELFRNGDLSQRLRAPRPRTPESRENS